MKLSRSLLASWLEEATAAQPPPTLTVDREGFDILERSMVGLRESPGLEPHDPGCYLFFLDNDVERRERDGRIDVGGIADQIAQAALASHRRLEVEWYASDGGDPDRSNDNDQVDSYIVLTSGRELPTVGPGGRVVMEEHAGTVFGSAAIRPFVEIGVGRTWTSADAVLAELTPFIDGELECFPAFGYYERSWMERQTLIHPTFLFVIETDVSATSPSRWIVTMSATTREENIGSTDELA